eukprot:symbB.v1.2.027895.t1/scaffold2895.1/size67727/7
MFMALDSRGEERLLIFGANAGTKTETGGRAHAERLVNDMVQEKLRNDDRRGGRDSRSRSRSRRSSRRRSRSRRRDSRSRSRRRLLAQMSGFDYSKWDRLEISDDEDTFHPNLDKGLNIRVNRITRDRKEDEINDEVKRLTDKGELEKAAKLEAKRPLHVDNVCHIAEERTIIQSSDGSKKDRLTRGEEFSVDEYTLFKEDNQSVLDRFTHADWQTSEVPDFN